MIKIKNIKKAVNGTDFEFYGIRIDENIRYNVGDVANNSHQLFQDPDFDENGELIHPYIEDGIYAGLYDAGELDGTCVIGFDKDDEASIKRALEQVKTHSGDNIHILGGDYAKCGNDLDEIIIRDAEVLGVYGKED